MKLLHIDSSILGEHSVSRKLSSAIVDKLKTINSELDIIYHDLSQTHVAHLSGEHMSVFRKYSSPNGDLKKDIDAGYRYIEEIFDADYIVLGVPMYNLSIPSVLKVWIDRVVVPDVTFSHTTNGLKGLLPPGKKLFIASSRGGVYTNGSELSPLDYQEKYILSVLGSIGLTDSTVIRAEGISYGEEVANQSIRKALNIISEISL
ncbi:NAD(P)H-dependent oxidoreductase [Klebsiella aerogenes]